MRKKSFNNRVPFSRGTLKTVIVFVILMFKVSLCNISVKAYSLDESNSDINISKPRIYIQNNGTEPISNFFYYYYFEIENGQTPFLEDYYTPDAEVMVEALGGSKYRIKYTVSGTVAPGQCTPDASGGTIGLHYNTWSVWDKINDYSYNASGVFLENQTIAVYVNGIRIYGTEPGYNGQTPPDTSYTSDLRLQNFALYSHEQSIVRDRCTFSGGGAIGSNGEVEICAQSIIEGNILSGGNIFLRSLVNINGDATAGGTIDTQSMVTVTGVMQENAQIADILIPQKTVIPGSLDTTVNSYQTVTLTPGAYRNLTVHDHGIIVLNAGTYSFNDFWIDTDAQIKLQTNSNQTIKIDIQGEMFISDRTQMSFTNFAYAPAVQIYSNDQNTISIGNNTIICGILTAPHATVTLFSKAKCDGAIYAKKIIVEPEAVISSGMVDPENDSDNDMVSNYLEYNGPTHTNPTDATSYMDYVLPDKSYLDNTIENNMYLDFSTFYELYKGIDSIPFYIAPNQMSGALPPLFQMRNLPEGVTSIPDVPQYLPVSLSMNIVYWPFASGLTCDVPVPFPAEYVNDGSEAILVIKQNGTWDVIQPGFYGENYVIVPVDNTVKSLILLKKDSGLQSAVAYLDGGMIYSQSKGTQLFFDMVLDECGTAQAGTCAVYYTDLSDPANPVDTVKTVALTSVQNNGSSSLIASEKVDFSGKIRIRGVEFNVSSLSIQYSKDSLSLLVEPGQMVKVTIHEKASDFNTVAEPVILSYGIPFTLESVDLEGEGRICQTRNDTSVTYHYDYYLKDHLGSTRMVLTDQNSISEEIAYQAYGSIEPLRLSSSPSPTRQQFTGKEFDNQGADFARVEFDIQVTGYDPGFSRGNLDVTYQDKVTGTHFTKRYRMNADAGTQTLWYKGSETYTDDIIITDFTITGNNLFYNISPGNYDVPPGETKTISLSKEADSLRQLSNNYFNISLPDSNSTYFAGTRLFYFGARFYDPELGLWLSCDPAGQFASPYLFAGNGTNVISYIDENGEWVHIVIGAAIGAVINVVTNIGHIHNAGQFFGYLGLGAVQGGLTAALGPGGAALGGAITGAGNALLGGGTAKDAVMGGLVGGFAGFAGSAASSAASPLISKLSVSIGGFTSPFINGAIKGAFGGSIGGYVGGFIGGLIVSGGDFSAANQAGLSGLKSGAIIGGISGAVTSSSQAIKNNQNPFLIKQEPPTSAKPNLPLTPKPGESTKTLYRGMTGNEGKGPLYLTDDPAYADGYRQNGGNLAEFGVSESNFNTMRYLEQIREYRGYNSSTGQYGTEYKITDPLIIDELLNLGRDH